MSETQKCDCQNHAVPSVYAGLTLLHMKKSSDIILFAKLTNFTPDSLNKSLSLLSPKILGGQNPSLPLFFHSALGTSQGCPGSVRLGCGSVVERFERFRFSVPVVPLGKGVFLCFSIDYWKGTVPVPVSVPGKRFRRFRFRLRLREKRFRRFRFPVSVRFLSHPASVDGRRDCKHRSLKSSREQIGETGFENSATLHRTEEHCRPQNRPRIGKKMTKNRISALFGLFFGAFQDD